MTSCDKKIIVAIDGFSSSGKSTMAKRLARTVGYRYIDSGAMYRAVTYYALSHGLVGSDGSLDRQGIVEALPSISIDFLATPRGQRTLLNGEDVEEQIRTLEVSNLVSPIAAMPEVRRTLTSMQKAYGRSRGIVMDGRDIGTAVFPDAELKIFVDASAETRARRRWLELQQKGSEATYEEVLENVRSRDHIDSTRAESPLRCAPDALRFDNSDLTLDRQDELVLKMFRDACHR